MNNQLIKFETNTGLVELSPQIVKDFIVNGNGKVTDQEVELFINLCKYKGLNPLIKEAHLIKFGEQPAQMVVSYDVFKNRADTNPHNKGWEAGVILVTANGDISYRIGALKLPNETLVGGWCEVKRDDRDKPTRVEVSFEEYVGLKNDGTPNKQWATKPAFMIRKVAIAQGLREAFPNDLNGLYVEEENTPITSVQEIIQGEVVELITSDERKHLFEIAKGRNDIVKAVLTEFGYEKSNDVAKEHYEEICLRIVEELSKLA